MLEKQMKPKIVSAETETLIRDCLGYDPETGVFTWLVDLGDRIKAGQVAGSLNNAGYIQIGLNGKTLRAHRLGWFLHTGSWPVGILDHCDTVKTHNRFSNLRDCTQTQNLQNSNSRGGAVPFKGVAMNRNRFRAYIKINGKQISLGTHDTPEEAALTYNAAAIKHFGEFARINVLLP